MVCRLDRLLAVCGLIDTTVTSLYSLCTQRCLLLGAQRRFAGVPGQGLFKPGEELPSGTGDGQIQRLEAKLQDLTGESRQIFALSGGAFAGRRRTRTNHGRKFC